MAVTSVKGKRKGRGEVEGEERRGLLPPSSTGIHLAGIRTILQPESLSAR
jgi:hypothetical protein